MSPRQGFSADEARQIGEQIGILNEFPDYYTRLELMEAQAPQG